MDETSQKKLDQLLQLEPEALSATDRAFLRARASYIPKANKDILKDVLKETVTVKEERSSGLRAFQLLKKRAKALGIDTKGMNAEALNVSILSLEGPSSI